MDRRKALNDIYKNKPCMDCGGTFPFECMDFDHVRGTKLGNLNKLFTGAAMETILAEIAKCELVCSNCHRIRTRKRRLNIIA
jgi:hypothetical protein